MSSSSRNVSTEQTVPAEADRSSELLKHISRCAYMIDCHRRGIAINSQRIAAAQAELAELARLDAERSGG